MSEGTARLGLPLLSAGQAQKEMTHNEALALLDMLTTPGVVAVGIDTPPQAPVAGETWIVGSQPTGAWSGRGDAIAGWTGDGWRFVAPVEGFAAWSIADTAVARWTDSTWHVGEVDAAVIRIGGMAVVGARRPAIADPAGGATIDGEARVAIAAILAALRGHGLIAA